jgi:hypothetical protein
MPNTCKSNEKVLRDEYSGARVSNAWVIYLWVGNNSGKLGLIPHNTFTLKQQCAWR